MLSIPHLIIIFVVALVVFGPEKLPELARNLGKVMAEFRRATGDLRSTFEDHLRDLEREADSRRIGGKSSPLPPQPASVPEAGIVPAHPPNSAERLGPLSDSPDTGGGSPATADQSDSQAGKTGQTSETVSDGHSRA